METRSNPLQSLYLLYIQTRREVYMLRKQVDELSRRIAAYQQPPRLRWQRTELPAFESEELPVVSPDDMPTERLPAIQARRIQRVTLDSRQYVRAYDDRGLSVAQFTGPYSIVGLPLLAKTAHLQWELVDAPPVVHSTIE